MGFLQTENAGQLLGTGSMGWGRGCQSQPELGGASLTYHLTGVDPAWGLGGNACWPARQSCCSLGGGRCTGMVPPPQLTLPLAQLLQTWAPQL